MPAYARAVLDVVDAIPRGRVLSYGDVAELAGIRSARVVGAVLSRYGVEVPWHRVLRADGSCAGHLAKRQLAMLRREGVPVRDGRVDMSRARWVPSPPS